MVRPAQRQEAPWASPALLFPWKAVVSAGEGHGAHPRKVSPAAAPGAGKASQGAAPCREAGGGEALQLGGLEGRKE